MKLFYDNQRNTNTLILRENNSLYVCGKTKQQVKDKHQQNREKRQ